MNEVRLINIFSLLSDFRTDGKNLSALLYGICFLIICPRGSYPDLLYPNIASDEIIAYYQNVGLGYILRMGGANRFKLCDTSSDLAREPLET